MKFYELSGYFLKLEDTSKRLEMFDILSEAFSKSESEEIGKIVYLIEGELLPAFFGVQFGVADKMVEKAIAEAYDVKLDKIEAEYKKAGDLGKVAESENKSESGSKLSVSEVYDELFSISKISGEGSVDVKIKTLASLFKKTSKLEAKYIARFVIGRLRLGVGEATIMEALSKAKTGKREFKKELEKAFNFCSDLGYVAEIFYKSGEESIKRFKVQVMRPIRPALAERLSSAKEIIEKLGKCALDQKFDGFRAQVHKKGDEVKVFSRNLEDITNFMPEIVKEIKKIKHDRIIFDSESLTYDEDTNTLYPFQITIQRKRKHNVLETSEKYPLRLFVFDIMLLDEESLVDKPYIERRKMVEKLFPEDAIISRSKIIITDSEKEFEKFFDDTVSSGLEGVVAKRLDGHYAAGARNFNWIKIKRSYKSKLNDTIDLVILGYFKGRGARADLGVGAVLAGVYDDKDDSFKTLSKVGSGFSEEQFRSLKKMLDDIKMDHKPARVDSIMVPDVWVEPKYVITVKADEITRSPMHTAGMENEVGYALRFPRAVSFIREDKNANDANTVKEIKEMFKEQKNLKIS